MVHVYESSSKCPTLTIDYSVIPIAFLMKSLFRLLKSQNHEQSLLSYLHYSMSLIIFRVPSQWPPTPFSYWQEHHENECGISQHVLGQNTHIL